MIFQALHIVPCATLIPQDRHAAAASATLSPALAALMAPVARPHGRDNGRSASRHGSTRSKGPPLLQSNAEPRPAQPRAPRGQPALAFIGPGMRASARNPVRGGRDTPRLGRPFSAGPTSARLPTVGSGKLREVAMRAKRSVFLAIVASVAFTHAAAGGRPRRRPAPCHQRRAAAVRAGVLLDRPLHRRPRRLRLVGRRLAVRRHSRESRRTTRGSGALVGGQIGYNMQVRQFVFGAEADISSAWLDGSSACPDPAFNCGHSYQLADLPARSRRQSPSTTTARCSMARRGVAWADVDYAAKDAVTGAAFGTGFSNTHVGWVAGAGIEHMLTPNLTARIEYLYYGFNSVTAPAGALGGGPDRPRSQRPRRSGSASTSSSELHLLPNSHGSIVRMRTMNAT